MKEVKQKGHEIENAADWIVHIKVIRRSYRFSAAFFTTIKNLISAGNCLKGVREVLRRVKQQNITHKLPKEKVRFFNPSK